MEFIKTLLKAKAAPKNALRFISEAMGTCSYTVVDGLPKHNGFAAELLGGTGELTRLMSKPGGRPEINILAMVMTGFRLQKEPGPPVLASALSESTDLPVPTCRMGDAHSATWSGSSLITAPSRTHKIRPRTPKPGKQAGERARNPSAPGPRGSRIAAGHPELIWASEENRNVIDR